MRFFSVYVLLFFFLVPATLFAQSDSFTIKVFPNDFEAPTAPVLNTVDPVTPDQINVSWSASTDNFMVQGYVLYRDGSAIATTTLSSYSDAGLTASTTYAYNVYAFDYSFNYSSSSNVIATTTPNPPPPPAEEETDFPEQTAARVVLDDVVITEGYTTSLFNITTKRPARILLRWGRTTSYEMGYVMNNFFLSEYETTITDLEPGTTYEYEIIGYTPIGNEFLLKQGRFTTLAEEVITIPANVNRFRSVVEESDVRLFWDLPVNEDVAYVRILRSHLGYPTHLTDGAIVYQGLGTSAVDEGILDVYSPVYYTAFVVDSNGTVSSGAILRVTAGEGNVPGAQDDISNTNNNGMQVFDDKATIDMIGTDSVDGYRIPDLSEIFIFQEKLQYTFAYDDISLLRDVPFLISIPKNTVSGNLKSIIVTVVDPTDTRQEYSYLLKINADQTAYEATISPLSVVGMSWLALDIYDYESRIVSTYRTDIYFSGESKTDEIVFPDVFIEHAGFWFLISIIPLLLWLLIVLLRRDEEEE